MEQKKYTYESDSIRVTYDVKRCIHARECVRGLNAVFDPAKRPWIQPDRAEAGEIMEVTERCPTGALHYELKDSGRHETAPATNTLQIVADGPVYVRGNIELQDEKGETLLQDTRMAICRCGHSRNKPLCDNSHKEIHFSSPSSFNFDLLKANEDDPAEHSSTLVLKVQRNGPILVQGNYVMSSAEVRAIRSSKNTALCRCGGSGNKPFCDGSHKKIGFESESD